MKINCVKAYWHGCNLIHFYFEIDVKGMNIENNSHAFYVSEFENSESSCLAKNLP
jgi:hypothetical protein